MRRKNRDLLQQVCESFPTPERFTESRAKLPDTYCAIGAFVSYVLGYEGEDAIPIRYRFPSLPVIEATLCLLALCNKHKDAKQSHARVDELFEIINTPDMHRRITGIMLDASTIGEDPEYCIDVRNLVRTHVWDANILDSENVTKIIRRGFGRLLDALDAVTEETVFKYLTDERLVVVGLQTITDRKDALIDRVHKNTHWS